MTRQNRVLPTGEIVADPHRGLFMGNRGILHEDAGKLGVSRWKNPHWICCVLSFKERHRQVMAPRRYTELFFLDEAVAMAAGHRPCAECRRGDYNRWRDAWTDAFGARLSAHDMDRVLHKERVTRDRRQRCFVAKLGQLPDGAFVIYDDQPCLLHDKKIWVFSTSGYAATASVRFDIEVTVLTPKSTIGVLKAGYRPKLLFDSDDRQ